MPRTCPSVGDYQKLLSGESPPEVVDQLASHLESCGRCTAAVQTLLNEDTLGDNVRSVGSSPALSQLPPALVSKLLALSASAPVASAFDVGATTDGTWSAPVHVGEDTLYLPESLSAPQAPDEIGRLGGYRVLEALGQGGMGIVYLAEDIQLQRRVALKVMKPELARNDGARKRFLAEARAAAKVKSDHVVTIYQTGEDGGTAFAAMELLSGDALDGWLKTHRDAPLTEFVRIARETALGLAAAHEQGLIHRDIKPGNIWVEDSGRVKILDFGLARSVEGDVHLTKTGSVVGTPAFMAPEQARGEKVDLRADLFSLGCVMHRLVTGQMPFKGDTIMSVLTALAVDSPAPAHELNSSVPRRLSDLITRLLAKKPSDRPHTARAAADEMKAILAEMTVTSSPSTIVYVPRSEPVHVVQHSAFEFEAEAKPAPAPRPAAQRPRRRPLVFVGIAALLLIVGAVAASQFVFATKDGTLVVEVDDDADVRFKKGKLEIYENGVLKYTLEPSDKNKAVAPGKYLVKVVGADGVKIETETFEMERKGKAFVRVKATGPTEVAGKDPKKPIDSDARFALRFDVHSDGIKWNQVDMPTLKLPTKDSVTVEGWVKLDDPLGGYNNVLFGALHYQLVIGRFGGQFYMQPEKGGKQVSIALPKADVEKAFFAAGKWQHVAVVRDADEVRVYLDGKLQARAECKGSLANGSGFVLGNAGQGLSVREVRVSSVARYAGEKFAPESRFTPDKQTLALYHCDEGRGEAVADSSGNGHHGKITGFGPDGMTKWVKVDAAPGDPVSLPPFVPGTPLALRKPTWKPGPADNILTGLVTRPAILEGFGRWQIVPTAVPATALAFSPDGKWVATADADYVRIYNAVTGEFKALGKRTSGSQHAGGAWGLDWSADSKWVRAASFRALGFDNGDVFAPDGTRSPVPWIPHANPDFGWNPKFPVFASIIHDQDHLQIFDPTQAKPVVIETKQGWKGRPAWSPDGEALLVVREDKTAQLFARDGTPGAKLAGEVDPTVVPAWSADSKQIAARASANEVGFWNRDGTAGKKTGKHDKPILALHWKPDGKLLAVSDAEGKRHFWKTDGTSEGVADTKDGTPGFVWAKDGKGFFTPGLFWPAVGNPSFTVLRSPGMWETVSPDQKSVALAKRGEITVEEWKDGEAKDIGWKVLQTRDGQPWWSADGKRLAVAEQNGVTLYDARDSMKVVRLGGGAGVNGLNRAAFSPKGDRLAVANDIGHLIVCEPTGRPLKVLATPGKVGASLADAIHDIQWHPDGNLLAVTTGSVTVTVYDTTTGKAEATTSVVGLRAGGSAIFSPANPDHLLITHPDAGAALWRWKVEKEPLQKFDGLGKLVLSPDGKRFLSFISGGWAGRPYIQPALVSPDLKERTEIAGKEFVPINNQPGADLAWHPDGKHLVVTRLGEVRSIQIRSLNGKVVEEIKPDGIDVAWLEWVEPVAKRNVLVGRCEGTVYLFDLTTKKLTAFGKVNGELTVSPDGKHLIALEGSTMTYWNVDTKAVEQKVVLLPNGEFVTLSVAGEVLEKSANADNYYRYLVEDKTGKLLLKTPAEMAPSLPK